MAAPLLLIMAAFALVATVFVVAALLAVRRRHVVGTAMSMLLGCSAWRWRRSRDR